MRHRHWMLAVAATMVASAIPGVAAAKANNGVRPNQGGCPPGAWVANNFEQWLAATLAGIASEGTTVEAVAAQYGVDPSAFDGFIYDGVFGPDGVDFNGDGVVCRGTNDPPALPDFLFTVDDNKFHVKFAG